MTQEEFFDFYDEHWNDYNKVMDKLHILFDEHEAEIAELQKRLTESYMSNTSVSTDDSKMVKELKALLLECQDKLDEETHKL